MNLRSAHKLSYREYQHFPNDGHRHEIIDGDHFMSPAPSTKHQTVSRHLQFQLYSQLELTGRGKVFNAPTDVELTTHDIVQPDLIVILKANERIIKPKRIRGIPDCCIEIVSESNPAYDRILKLEMYQRAGVPEYWLVDPDEETIEIHSMQDQRGYSRRVVREGSLSLNVMPDVQVEIDKIWRS